MSEKNAEDHIDICGCHPCNLVFGSVQVTSLEKKQGGYDVKGVIRELRCPRCHAPMHLIAEAIPVELRGLVCECGCTEFDVQISTLKLELKQRRHVTDKDWSFELDVRCLKCTKGLSTIQKILGTIHDIEKISIGLKGVTVKMKRPRK